MKSLRRSWGSIISKPKEMKDPFGFGITESKYAPGGDDFLDMLLQRMGTCFATPEDVIIK